MLRIADLEFDVASCRLEPFCTEDNIQWDIEVNAQAHPDGMFHGVKPKLSLSLFETPPGAFEHWTELAPREARWVEENDTDVVPMGMLYIFEHTLLYECVARLDRDTSGLRIQVDGKCDVYYDEEYEMNLDLHLDSLVAFRGISFGEQPEAACRKELSVFLDPDDFDFTETEDGISMLTPK